MSWIAYLPYLYMINPPGGNVLQPQRETCTSTNHPMITYKQFMCNLIRVIEYLEQQVYINCIVSFDDVIKYVLYQDFKDI